MSKSKKVLLTVLDAIKNGDHNDMTPCPDDLGFKANPSDCIDDCVLCWDSIIEGVKKYDE